MEGELRNLKRPKAGHVYFDLVDATWDGPEAGRPTLSVALFDTHRRNVNAALRATGGALRMTDGVRIRIGGRVRTYPARSSLQLVMDRIDPSFTLGVLSAERAQLLERLRTEGLLEINASRPLPVPPLHVGIVTSAGSAAAADVLDELASSGFGFKVSFLDARTQGLDAPRSVISALRTAEALAVDVVLLVRGGGAATDLAAFDDEAVARTIAGLSVPVITGIGHETDRCVADEVAHVSHKTPTAAAAAVVAAAAEARSRLHDAAVAVATGAQGALVRAGDRLERTARICALTASRDLVGADAATSDLQRRVTAGALGAPQRARARVDAVAARTGPAALRGLEALGHRLDSLSSRARVHDPEAALARGWSITRSSTGRLVRAPADVEPGEVLVTTTAGGDIRSTAEPDGSRSGEENT